MTTSQDEETGVTDTKENTDPNVGVILRVRMRNGLRTRIRRIAEHDASLLGEAIGMSDVVREALLPYIIRREAEIEHAKSAAFQGKPPTL